MRKALDRIVELYKTNAIYQDLLETAAGTGLGTAYQAIVSDMKPAELALAAGMGFGTGMVGRPALGPVGGYVGRQITKRLPKEKLEALEASHQNLINTNFGGLYAAKFAPYARMSAPEAMGNAVARELGDNVAQGLVTIAMPHLFTESEEGG